MADPNQPMSLNKAITPVGTCTSMCPQFERVERIVQKMVDKSEKVSSRYYGILDLVFTIFIVSRPQDEYTAEPGDKDA
jgi:hypothetical protein